MQLEADAAVIGGGLVGISVGYGLALQNIKSIVLDEGDVAIRASRGNFGLVWVQGKGLALPAYTEWAMRAVEWRSEFASRLLTETGIDVGLTRKGGVYLCRSAEAMAQRGTDLAMIKARFNGSYEYDMLDSIAVRKLVPEPVILDMTGRPMLCGGFTRCIAAKRIEAAATAPTWASSTSSTTDQNSYLRPPKAR